MVPSKNMADNERLFIIALTVNQELNVVVSYISLCRLSIIQQKLIYDSQLMHKFGIIFTIVPIQRFVKQFFDVVIV